MVSINVSSPADLARGVVAALVTAPAVAGSLDFDDVTDVRGIDAYQSARGMIAGVAAADVDDDGDVDVFLPQAWNHANALYLNQGNGHFVDVAAERGLASMQNSRGALFLDVEDDGDLDLLVVCDDHNQGKVFVESSLRLYLQQEDGRFVESGPESGLWGRLYPTDYDVLNHASGLAASDLDGDGDLDLLVTFWRGRSHLFENRGDGTFVDRTMDAGLHVDFEYYWQPIIHDFNGDGHDDVFIAADLTTNDLFLNHGEWTFVNVAAGLGIENDNCGDMGATLGDYDDDGDFDLFVSNLTSLEACRNHLFRNESAGGVPAFTETAVETGTWDADWGWGTTFADFDGDTYLDVAATNGFDGWDDPTVLFRQQPDASRTFLDVARESGFADTDWGMCIVAVDLDRDGDPDTLQTTNDGPLRYLANRAAETDPDSTWLTIRPRQEGRNHRAIGAAVRIDVGDRTIARPILAGTSMLGQEPAEACFGLGGLDVAERVEIEWPDGERTVLRGVSAGGMLSVMRWACPGDVDDDGRIDGADVALLLEAWGTGGYEARTELDGDGTVGAGDLLVLLRGWGDCDR